MLEFSLHELQLGSRHYLLLPKLTGGQMRTLIKRLGDKGFTTSGDSQVLARRQGMGLGLNSSGLCWSTKDPADFILPLLPEILETSKELVPLEELTRRYFVAGPTGSRTSIRLVTRIEGGRLWGRLRGTDQSGFAPDEHAVLVSLLGHSHGGCRLVTDFPTPSCRARVVGGRRYFESQLDAAEAVTTLRRAGARGPRNSYLPKSCILELEAFTPPPRLELADLFEGLGQWCYLRA